jgi:hypothetical protein
VDTIWRRYEDEQESDEEFLRYPGALFVCSYSALFSRWQFFVASSFLALSCLLLLISALPSAFRQESRSQPGTIRKLNDSLTLLSDVACLLHANLQVV